MTFDDGIEAAAREIEGADCGLFGKQLLAELAAKVRAIQARSGGSAVTVLSKMDATFEMFKEEYPKGPRNHWTPARKAFEKAVKRGHKPEAIIRGAQAFAASGKQTEFIEAPAVFLNQDRFLTEYDVARPNMLGSSGLFAISDALHGNV